MIAAHALQDALIRLAVDGDLSGLRKAISRLGVDFDVNAADGDGRTALWHACEAGQLDVVKFLVEEKQADVHKVNHDEETPLLAAACNEHDATVEYLLSREANLGQAKPKPKSKPKPPKPAPARPAPAPLKSSKARRPSKDTKSRRGSRRSSRGSINAGGIRGTGAKRSSGRATLASETAVARITALEAEVAKLRRGGNDAVQALKDELAAFKNSALRSIEAVRVDASRAAADAASAVLRAAEAGTKAADAKAKAAEAGAKASEAKARAASASTEALKASAEASKANAFAREALSSQPRQAQSKSSSGSVGNDGTRAAVAGLERRVVDLESGLIELEDGLSKAQSSVGSLGERVGAALSEMQDLRQSIERRGEASKGANSAAVSTAAAPQQGKNDSAALRRVENGLELAMDEIRELKAALARRRPQTAGPPVQRVQDRPQPYTAGQRRDKEVPAVVQERTLVARSSAPKAPAPARARAPTLPRSPVPEAPPAAPNAPAPSRARAPTLPRSPVPEAYPTATITTVHPAEPSKVSPEERPEDRPEEPPVPPPPPRKGGVARVDRARSVSAHSKTLRDGYACFHGIDGQRIDKAHGKSMLMLSAEMGSLYAKANCLMLGWGVDRDSKKGIQLLEKAAKAGSPYALCRLGVSYHYGQGVARSRFKAIQCFRNAASQGFSRGEFWLGMCHQKGQGLPQDFRKAVDMFRAAADKGDVMARRALGACYEKGQGVKMDKKEALAWYRLSAAQGHSQSQHAVRTLEAPMQNLAGTER